MIDNDKIYEVIESTANMLRGMTLDPAIPDHAKQAMMLKILKLEGFILELEKVEGL